MNFYGNGYGYFCGYVVFCVDIFVIYFWVYIDWGVDIVVIILIRVRRFLG